MPQSFFRSHEIQVLLVSLWITLTCNLSFWHAVAASDTAGSLPLPFFYLSIGVLTWGLVCLVLLLVAHGRLVRPVLTLALIVSAATSYFMDSFGVLFDTDMLVNVVETNWSEAGELLSPGLFLRIAVLGLLPAFVLWRYRPGPRRLAWAASQRAAALLIALAMIVTPLLATQKEIYSLARNHQEVRHLIAPLNVMLASWKYVAGKFDTPPVFRTVALDAAHVGMEAGRDRPFVHVLVVGETARAANFSLGDYARDTNPRLRERPGVRFNEARSCGTATAASLPCMFAPDGREQFDASIGKHSDNLLDIAQRAGYDVVWLDNGNSCKGVCARVRTRDVHASDVAELCPGGECFDEILVHELKAMLPTINRDTLIVLHQLGSHGPAYFRRYPAAFRRFVPDCRSPNLGDCSDEQIVNAYDNTILYTDHVIDAAIAALADAADRLDASLTYVSDHGESLGEGNLYLHGMPYRIAPEQQTRVPMISWSSEAVGSVLTDWGRCTASPLALPVSHDHLFHTELGNLNITSAIYDPSLDIRDRCVVTASGATGGGSGAVTLAPK